MSLDLEKLCHFIIRMIITNQISITEVVVVFHFRPQALPCTSYFSVTLRDFYGIKKIISFIFFRDMF